MSNVTPIVVGKRARNRPAKGRPTGTAIETIRAVDGCRSPYFNALRRRARLIDDVYHDFKIDLDELREVVIPWLRIPIYTYWRRRTVHAERVEVAEVVVRTFLETGHVPAPRYL